ncbi:hypothetical protein PV326_002016, partial [Microctonus aethiopoides]
NNKLIMGDRVRHKGKFIKKKVLDKRMKIVNSLRQKKAAKNDNKPVESNLGFHSSLRVNCMKCNTLSIVSTGKLHSVNNNNRCKHSNITTGVVLGAIQAGYGCSGLNKILACANMPTISTNLFKRYEREVGPAIEKAAQESCKKAANEERKLVFR